MTRLARLGVGLAFTLGFVLIGCEKDQPVVASPPEVVVEQPGVTPSPPVADDPDPDPEADPQSPDGSTKIVATQVPCQTDADCRKSTCCHATECVAAADAPDCSSVACTMDCRAGTMDCNGGCLCQAGTCAAKLWWAPVAD